MTSPVIQAQSLSYALPSRSILKSLDFGIQARSFTVVVGENGAGKTTLLQLLMGIIEPSQGSIRVLGQEPYRDPAADRAHVGYVAEKITPPMDWTVEDYLRFNRAFYPDYAVATESRLIREFRLKPEWKIGTLSAGQVRRAQVVGVLAASPKLLVIDEITAVLDIVGRAKFMAALERLRDERDTTIIMATNILDDVDSYATDVVLLHEGRLTAHQSKAELLAAHAGKNLTQTLAAMIEAAEEEGAAV